MLVLRCFSRKGTRSIFQLSGRVHVLLHQKKAEKAGKAVIEMNEPELTVERSIDELGREQLTYTVKVTLTEPPSQLTVELDDMNKYIAHQMKKLIEDQIIEDACLILKGGFEPNTTMAGYNIHVHRSVSPKMVIMSPQAYDEFLKYADESYIRYIRDTSALGLRNTPHKQINKRESDNPPSEVLPE